MMNFKKFFEYQPNKNRNFLLPLLPNNLPAEKEKEISIFDSLEKNLEYLKVKYNLLINSDINTREFEISVSSKSFKALLIFIDGITNSDSINNHILEPLMLRNTIKMNPSKNIKLNHVQKFDLQEFLLNKLISQNVIQISTNFKECFEKINSGFAVLFVDSLNIGICIEEKDYQTRAVSTPQTESVVRGSQASFIENLRTNTAQIRKIINNENLIIENTKIGDVTQTNVSICYMKNITNDNLVSEVKFRLNNIQVDSLTSSGELENLIKDNIYNLYPELIATERPDKTSNFILGGRIAILVDGSPFALIVPALLLDFLASTEDVNLNNIFANLLKIIRAVAFFIAVLLPAIYISVTTFHDEFLPTELLLAIVSAREKIPFPIIVEIILMELSFELIREAGIRVPSAFGQTIGIVGALILGEAAVTANVVSPILVIIIAITAISEFTLPDYSFSFSTRIFRLIYIFLGYFFGLFGVSCGIFAHFTLLFSYHSFGVPFFSYRSFREYWIKPIWKEEKRKNTFNTKRPIKEPSISMKWRKHEK